MTSLRVLHLATTLRGGAGIAARRTHEALLESGINSRLMCLTDNQQSQDFINVFRRPVHIKYMSKFVTLIQSKLFQNSDRLVTPISIKGLSDSLFRAQDFDVLHIHSFYNMLSIKNIREIAEQLPSKKIFVTMHDQRIFTGGCHYSGDCLSYLHKCSDCPQVGRIGKVFVKISFQESMKALENLRNLVLIAPSYWLMEKSRESRITSGIKTQMIRNPIPSCFFDAKEPKTSSVKKIYFISANLNNSLKGIETLIPSLNNLQMAGLNFEVVFIGKGHVNGLNPGIKFTVTTASNDLQMAKLLSEANILVVPSIEDNLPSTMLEALASNCIVIGSRVGGISEVLNSAKMQTFNVGDVAELTRCITNSLQEESRPDNSISQEYSYENVARELVQAYSAL